MGIYDWHKLKDLLVVFDSYTNVPELFAESCKAIQRAFDLKAVLAVYKLETSEGNIWCDNEQVHSCWASHPQGDYLQEIAETVLQSQQRSDVFSLSIHPFEITNLGTAVLIFADEPDYEFSSSDVDLLQLLVQQLNTRLYNLNNLSLFEKSLDATLTQLNDELIKQSNLVEQLELARMSAEAGERAKTSFVNTLSHELRTPLTAIISYSEILSKKVSHQPDLAEYTNRIVTNSHFLRDLVNDLLQIAKNDTSVADLTLADFDLHDLMMVCLSTFEANSKTQNLIFEVEIDENLPVYVRGDRKRLQQILFNLISNAFKYTEKGMIRLYVTLDEDKGDVIIPRFSISDTGIGIPDHRLDDIFKEFHQVHSDDVASTGVGLGLAICKQLVHLMNGQIDVESTLGIGSTFSFTAQLERTQNNSGKSPNALFETTEMLSVDLSQISKSLIDALIESIIHGDADSTVQITEQITQEHPQIGSWIALCVKEYKFDYLLGILEEQSTQI